MYNAYLPKHTKAERALMKRPLAGPIDVVNP